MVRGGIDTIYTGGALKGSDQAEKIFLVEEERANLACYFLRSLLRRSVHAGNAEKLSSRLAGGLKATTGGMTAYVFGTGQGIEISPVETRKPALSVEGDLPTLLSLLLGGGVLVPFLRGDIRFGGNPISALRVLGALRVKNMKNAASRKEGR